MANNGGWFCGRGGALLTAAAAGKGGGLTAKGCEQSFAFFRWKTDATGSSLTGEPARDCGGFSMYTNSAPLCAQDKGTNARNTQGRTGVERSRARATRGADVARRQRVAQQTASKWHARFVEDLAATMRPSPARGHLEWLQVWEFGLATGAAVQRLSSQLPLFTRDFIVRITDFPTQASRPV